MNVHQVLGDLNFVAQAKKYGIPLWQHPQFLFLVMGAVIILSSLLSYVLAQRYIADPHLVALSIIVLTLFLLILAFTITRSFERLAEAARLKSEFVSIVSHQLRSPLSNLTWAMDFLMSGRAGKIVPAQTEYLKVLKENSRRMQELVNDLLMVSRIEEGGVVPQRKEFSFSELVKSTARKFEPLLKAANIQMKVRGPDNLFLVFADPSQIGQVLENLLDNAIRYTGKTSEAVPQEQEKRNKIEISYEQRGKILYCKVQDRGVGIPKEDQRYIFQKFFRASNVLRHETQGSGLGLYIAKAIIERSGGKLGFESQEHKGSTFWFTLPIH